jgi:unsaturated rhamnogalacturonyl hydrolase
MKHVCPFTLIIAICLMAVGGRAYGASASLDPDDIVTVMKKVGDWQLDNLPEQSIVGGKMRPIDSAGWIRAAFFTGVMALYDTTGDRKYLDAAMSWAEANEWKPEKRPRHADDHCVGQTYAELYFIKQDPKMLAPISETFDAIVADPQRGPVVGWTRDVNWWWCDALYMAPPAMARLAAATGNRKYLECMNTMWWDVVGNLYDKEEHLFFRDDRYMEQPDGTWPLLSPNGKKIFWSRGNGWVMGGTVRVLQYMPQNFPDREKYITLFKEMAAKIASIQGDDGLWRASLLDPVAYPAPETSGSGFFCYAITWGINQGILDRDEYLPVVEKAWQGLAGAVDKDGRLGWVQQVGADPKSVVESDSMEYGTGALLLAGSELVKLDLPVLKASNPLEIARPGEVMSIPLKKLGLPEHWNGRVALRAVKANRVVPSQVVDTDSDGKPDELVFQTAIGANAQRAVAVQIAPRTMPKKGSKVHAMFVPTRYDDFAWENDRIAFRMYGPALQNTDTKEKLISSGIDVWAKSVDKLVIEEWYQPGVNYHKDTGEGLDFYKVGPARGCGGLAVWDGGKMHLSENYTDWKIVANGPIRTIFDLTFAPWDVNGKKVSEVKRVTLDAGSNLNRFDSFFKTDGKAKPLEYAVGLTIAKVDNRAVVADKAAGRLAVWEPAGTNGNLGMAVVADPATVVDIVEAEGHNLVIAKTGPDGHATFYAGAGWDKSEQFSSAEEWNEYVETFAKRLATPIEVSVVKTKK